MHLLLAALSFMIAVVFAWSAETVNKETTAFLIARRQFLADPARASGLHCARDQRNICKHRIDIRISEEGRWDDVCSHNFPRTFQVARYYRITLKCTLPLHKVPLPELATLLMR